MPPYVLCSNRQAFELARRAPASLQALGEIKGFGRKTVETHGAAILEVLHGAQPQRGSDRPDPVQKMDGDDPVDPAANPALPAELPPHAEPAVGQSGPSDS
ncbi:MAG: hypothetical protein EXR77_17955 [Myxococcales bacterium]|nr:hypothetical protein [Myxococcales bacterium]